jgi:hypothetical protein
VLPTQKYKEGSNVKSQSMLAAVLLACITSAHPAVVLSAADQDPRQM